MADIWSSGRVEAVGVMYLGLKEGLPRMDLKGNIGRSAVGSNLNQINWASFYAVQD